MSPDILKTDTQQNIRGAAAVLADYAKQNNQGQLPSSINDWYSAVAAYSGATDNQAAQGFADEVFATMQSGQSRTTTEGQQLALGATPNLAPNRSVESLHLGSKASGQSTNSTGAECPATLNCRFVPAGYAQNSSDPANYGNYDHANRPQDMKINYIVIHDTEGSYQSAINHFQDTSSYVSGHYIIRSNDGAITQMVRNEDVAWGAGDWYVNMHAINIEHEAIAAQGNAWYTEAMYRSSATLVRYLANKYHIPLDRKHIIGHDNVPTLNPAGLAGQHWDPGPYWDWNHYMALLHGVSDETERATDTASSQLSHHPQGKVVAISPDFAQNQPPVTDCSSGTCVTLPAQGSNFVYLRTKPDANAPLLTDPYLHTNHSPGTDHIDDWGDKAVAGLKYVVADQQGDWTGIYYDNQVGWFYNPKSHPTARRSSAQTITPRPGLTTVPVYGGAYPEASAYPADVPVQNLSPIYTIAADQKYTVADRTIPTDYFYDATINYSLPNDHAVIIGNETYIQINFNHRFGFVKASDVTLGR